MRHTMATGLIMEGKTVTGVTVSRSGKMETLTAHAEVILAAGAFQSPQLLELSGIGDYDTLSQHGSETIHQLPAVGSNLHDHYISRLSWKLQDLPSLNSKTRGLGLAGELFKFATKRKGRYPCLLELCWDLLKVVMDCLALISSIILPMPVMLIPPNGYLIHSCPTIGPASTTGKPRFRAYSVC